MHSIYRISLRLYRIIRLLRSYLNSLVDLTREATAMVSILVIGRAGAGKSELVNSIFEADTDGISPVTQETQIFEGEREGVKIRVYDTVGFKDKLTGGKNHRNVLLDAAKLCDHFDLILICVKLPGEEADHCMFSELASYLHKEMWKKTVVVLTFADIFIQLKSIQESNDLEVQVEMRLNELMQSKLHQCSC